MNPAADPELETIHRAINVAEQSANLDAANYGVMRFLQVVAIAGTVGVAGERLTQAHYRDAAISVVVGAIASTATIVSGACLRNNCNEFRQDAERLRRKIAN